MGRVAELYRYPVKSMQGERVERLEFVAGAASGDRQWALVDATTGVFLSAKRHGRLLEAFARTEADGSVVIRLPDGADVCTLDGVANAALSDWLGHAVELRTPADGIAPAYESLSDSTDEDSATTTFQGPSAHFADFADVHLLTTASLRAAKALQPAGDWDVRRFRPTVLVDMGDDSQLRGEGFVEDEWVGSRVVLGAGATFVIFMKTIRCNLPTRAQPGLPKDASVARTLRDQHDFCLGVYGALRGAGVVNTGDPVVLQSA
jgi:hypothetical protein